MNVLEKMGFSAQDMEKALACLYFQGIDDADVFLEEAQFRAFSLSENKVKHVQFSMGAGLGVRAVSGESTGFAYADCLDKEALFKACAMARKVYRGGGGFKACVPYKADAKALYPIYNPLNEVSLEAQEDLLYFANNLAYSLDRRVVDVSAFLALSYQEVFVQRLDGGFASDVRPLLRFSVSVVVEEKGRRESGSAGGGGRDVFVELLPKARIEGWVREALAQALFKLQAAEAPAGRLPVVLGNGWAGVLLHEAVGHGLEGDFNRKGSSVFSGRVGEKVCSSLCTVVDAGNLPHLRGSYRVDDEGTLSQETVLIENGVLKGYLQDRMNARLMGVQATGNGRRQSYAHLPMPRMSNTFLMAGDFVREEMIASVDYGLFAEHLGGGQVDITTGQFVFSIAQGYLIEKGRLSTPIKGATLVGNGLEVMQGISMVGKDWALDEGLGTCGKNGQSVPVGVGQPSVKIDAITVGGTRL